MGDLGVDTAVESLGGGRYRATVSRHWEIWGPNGGYVAALALRAAGARSSFRRPAGLSCHFLGVAAFDEIDLVVSPLRSGRTAESCRVSLSQGGRPILEAIVWAIGDVEGLDHHLAVAPDVPPPGELRLLTELQPDGWGYPIWDNVEVKPVGWRDEPAFSRPYDPVWRQWVRLTPTATFTDPWIDAGRALVFLDVQGWPAAYQHHGWRWEHAGAEAWVAPSLDLNVAFHRLPLGPDWLLTDGHAPVGQDGLIGWTGRLWTVAGELVASGGGQLLCRRLGALSGTTPAGSPAPTAPPGSRS